MKRRTVVLDNVGDYSNGATTGEPVTSQIQEEHVPVLMVRTWNGMQIALNQFNDNVQGGLEVKYKKGLAWSSR